MDSGEVFWMVLGAGMPTIRHATEEAAHQEAQRLARNHYGAKFYVLKAVMLVEKNDVKTTVLVENDPNIPF